MLPLTSLEKNVPKYSFFNMGSHTSLIKDILALDSMITCFRRHRKLLRF